MNLAYWCILVAGVLPMLTVAVAKRGGSNYNNAAPREWMETLSGYRRRADYAHRNHFEAFPFFAAAVLVAEQRHGAQGAINALALAFIVIRVAYTGLYPSHGCWAIFA